MCVILYIILIIVLRFEKIDKRVAKIRSFLITIVQNSFSYRILLITLGQWSVTIFRIYISVDQQKYESFSKKLTGLFIVYYTFSNNITILIIVHFEVILTFSLSTRNLNQTCTINIQLSYRFNNDFLNFY